MLFDVGVRVFVAAVLTAVPTPAFPPAPGVFLGGPDALGAAPPAARLPASDDDNGVAATEAAASIAGGAGGNWAQVVLGPSLRAFDCLCG